MLAKLGVTEPTANQLRDLYGAVNRSLLATTAIPSSRSDRARRGVGHRRGRGVSQFKCGEPIRSSDRAAAEPSQGSPYRPPFDRMSGHMDICPPSGLGLSQIGKLAALGRFVAVALGSLDVVQRGRPTYPAYGYSSTAAWRSALTFYIRPRFLV